MAWKEAVPACFGAADAKFANHPADEGRAKEVIQKAKAEGASVEDLQKEMLWHLYKEYNELGIDSHFREQLETAKKIWDNFS